MNETIDEYQIRSDMLCLDVRIEKIDKELRYCIILPDFNEPTRAYMQSIKNKLARDVDRKSLESSGPDVIRELKTKFKKRLKYLIKNDAPGVDAETTNAIIVCILNDAVGLGQIEYLLNDALLEEIVINCSSEPVRVYHKKYGWLSTNIQIGSEKKIRDYAMHVASYVGEAINTNSPLLDAYLPNGDRINAVLAPLSDKGTSMTIRMFAKEPWTFPHFILNKTITPEILALLWIMIQYEMNILISGGTGSGKTSMLNILMPFIQPNQRIVSIEDTRELQLPRFLYWYPMKTRNANPEGRGEVTMSDLLINSLRMRPDRLILGEIRKRHDAEILFEAMHTGHSVYATIHADTSQQTLRRLMNPPLSIPPLMVEAIHLNLVMYRERRKGIRRIKQVSEVIPARGGDPVSVPRANVLYKWKARSDEIISSSEDIRLFQEISLHTGLSKSEILAEIDEKRKIIGWFVDNKINKLDDIGKIMRVYYLQKEDVCDVVEKNQKPDGLINE
ncbi:MAG: hypothetical protein B6U97_02105 [Candidatus Altiarchaeales archaeon ex4484_96]|nr:MAG: hypothetical protein B6U97_02105 [Candidatus Altiarchaeales archaeon ex4484_96]